MYDPANFLLVPPASAAMRFLRSKASIFSLLCFAQETPEYAFKRLIL